MKKTAQIAIPLTAGIVGIAAPAAAQTARPTHSESYGPSSQQVDQFRAQLKAAKGPRQENVSAYFQEFGAPFAEYEIGDRKIYRWGSGSTTVRGGTATVVRNEMLVTTDAVGTVLDVSYRRKFADTGPTAVILAHDK